MADRLSEFLRTRRFRPNALPTIAMLALVVLAVALGNWQRHRAMDREVQAAAFAAAVREPPVELPASVDPEALRYRAVRVRGEYVGAQQLLIDNKIHAGRAGFDVVTPLHIANSERYVLVDRGWVAQGVRRTDIPEVSAP